MKGLAGWLARSWYALCLRRFSRAAMVGMPRRPLGWPCQVKVVWIFEEIIIFVQEFALEFGWFHVFRRTLCPVARGESERVKEGERKEAILCNANKGMEGEGRKGRRPLLGSSRRRKICFNSSSLLKSSDSSLSISFPLFTLSPSFI